MNPTRYTRCVLLIGGLLLSAALPADARMYQWRDSTTGSLQFAGRPPPWYRNGQPGPRVRVYTQGRLIDDTAQRLDPARAAELRATALGITAAPGVPAQVELSIPASPPDSAAQVAHFKALLDSWDHTQNPARRAVQSTRSTPTLPPRN